MRHKRTLISISLAALMLVSLCAVCATTSVAAKDSSGAPANGLDSGTAVCSWGAGRLDVFAKGTNGNLWHKWWDGTWHNWEDLGAPQGAANTPTAASWGAGRIDVFVTGTDGALWHKWFDKGWSGWESLGEPMPAVGPYYAVTIMGTPAACSWGAGRLDVFAMGSNYELWHKWFSNGWQAWEGLGQPPLGGIDGSPGAVSTVSWGYPRVDVFVRGGDSTLWQLWWKNGWQAWHRFDDTNQIVGSDPSLLKPMSKDYYGSYSYAPAVCSWGANRLDVFFVTTQGQLQQKWFDGSWHPTVILNANGDTTASPSAVTWQLSGTTRIDIFTRGVDFALWQLYWANGWHGWYNLGLM